MVATINQEEKIIGDSIVEQYLIKCLFRVVRVTVFAVKGQSISSGARLAHIPVQNAKTKPPVSWDFRVF